MNKTYLLDVIKAAPPLKTEELALVLNSALFNRGGNAKEMAKLYQLIVRSAPDFSEEVLNKEKVYFEVFSDQTVVPRKLDKLIADLNKALRTYYLAKQYLASGNEDQQQIDWAAWLRRGGLAERSSQQMSRIKTQLAGVKEESLEMFRVNLLSVEEEHEWEQANNHIKGDLKIPDLLYQLDLFYFGYRTELQNRYLFQQKAAQLPALELENTGVQFYQQQSRLLEISVQINGLLNNDLPLVDEFQVLLKSIKEVEAHLSNMALAQFYTYLRGTCTLLINGGHLEFIPILQEINKDNLARGFLLVNGEISPNSYLNLVQIATRAKEFAWARAFTEEFKNRIVGGDADHFFFGLNMAQCFFAEGALETALEYLPEAPSSSHYHQMMRRLELKIYYEQNSDLLLYKLDAFRKYIERTAPKTLAASYRTLNLNFLNILLQLSQSPPKDKARSAILIERIEEKKLLAERSWLLEKARALG